MWSIGIKVGNSPLEFTTPHHHLNPVLTRKDVTDVPALFVADPFMIQVAGEWHMFFEVMNAETRRGEIAFATSPDGLVWRYRCVVLREEFHLSYPYIFEWRRDVYLIPETRNLGRVRIYRAAGFPTHWDVYAEAPEASGADPSIFEHAGRLWMFVCSEGHETLNLYSAEALSGPWVQHPCSPIVRNDRSKARPAGRVIVDAGRIIRFAQDCRLDYGTAVRAFEVAELSLTVYREGECSQSPVLTPSGNGWDGARSHHLDAHRLADGTWIACVDGSSLHEPQGSSRRLWE